MTIYASVFPKNPIPEKAQIEQMYRMAYRQDPSIHVPEDIDRFGLNVQKLKEFQEVEMKAPLDWCRKHVKGLWTRMTQSQKLMFLMSYMNSAVTYTTEILENLEGVLDEDLEGVMIKWNEAHTELVQKIAAKMSKAAEGKNA